MSTPVLNVASEPSYAHLVRLTTEAFGVAKEAAGTAAEGIATGSAALLQGLRKREKELDTLEVLYAWENEDKEDADADEDKKTLLDLVK